MTKSIQHYIENLQTLGKLPDGFILTPKQRALVKAAFVGGRIKLSKKAEPTLPHSVLRDKNGELFVLLGTPLGIPKAKQGLIKVAQNLATGKFCLVKITRVKALKEEP